MKKVFLAAFLSLVSISGVQAQCSGVLAGSVCGTPSTGGIAGLTRTPSLGSSGVLGTLTFGNATSGTVTLRPVTGALGTVTVSMPAATGTLPLLESSNTFTGTNQIFSNSSGNPQIRTTATSTNFAGAQFDNGSVTAQFGVTSLLMFKTTTASDLTIGTANVDALTFSGANQGIYTPNATGSSMGANTINALALYDNGLRTSRAVGSGSSGSTNNSSSGSGAYVAMTPTISIPANAITTNRMLRVRILFRFTTGGTAPGFQFTVRLGGTVVAELTGNTPANNLTTRTYAAEALVMGLAAPGAAAATETAFAGATNAFANTILLNLTPQPVNLATNGALTLDVQTQWTVAGVGTNTVTLMGITAELVN